MKAIIQYTDCMQDKRNIYMKLAECPCLVLKEKVGLTSIRPKITIVVDTYLDLQQTLYELNNVSIYGVNLVKWRY